MKNIQHLFGLNVHNENLIIVVLRFDLSKSEAIFSPYLEVPLDIYKFI